jgi:type VI secretion system protein ImpJ
MLLQQQHLQQHDRYWVSVVDARCNTRLRYGWGFSKLEIDETLLGLGKLALSACEGVMPDGTPFSLPREDDLPLPLDIPEDRRDALVVLALPLARPGVPEVRAVDAIGEARSQGVGEDPVVRGAADSDASGIEDFARYRRAQCVVYDSNAESDESVVMEVGRLCLRLAFADEVSAGYVTLGVARIVERGADNAIVLDRKYAPPVIDYRVAAPLAGFVGELVGLLHQRGEALAERLAQPGVSGAAEIADFLLLQTINRVEPLFAHFAQASGLHPESLYRELLQLAGELAGFSAPGRRAMMPAPYRHDGLKETFEPLVNELRRALSMVMNPQVVAIALECAPHGMRIGRVADKKLLDTAAFVLSVKADMSTEALLASLPAQLKAGPVEKIHDLVNLQLPGLGLRMLPAAPRQLPFRANCSYFALDAGDALWKEVVNSAGIALHVAGEFPGLELELWAIRQ